MFSGVYDRIEDFLARLEDRMGRWGAASVVAVLIMLLACLYVRPAINCSALGCLYQRMAEDPFTFIKGNYVAFRILTPLLSWLIGLRGELIMVTNNLIAGIFLATIYYYFRQRSFRRVEALISVVVFGFSLVTLTTIYYGGYCDSLTYLIVLLMWWHRSKRWLYFPLLLCGLLNREAIIFLLPWFVVVGFQEHKRRLHWLLDSLLGYSLVAVIYILFRQLIMSQGEVPFDVNYYLEPLLTDPLHWLARSYPWQGLGLFSVFKVNWLIPLYVAWMMWRDRQWGGLWALALILVPICSQLLIAYDSSRMLTLGFPMMLIALEYLHRIDRTRFRGWVIPLLGFNFLIPQLYTALNIVEIMRSTPGNIISIWIFGREGW